MSWLGTSGAVHRLGDHPLGRGLLGHRLVDLRGVLQHDLEGGRLGVVHPHATGLGVEERLEAGGRERVPHGVEVTGVVRARRRRRQEDGPQPGGGDPLDLGDGVVDVGDRHGSGRADAVEVPAEPLDDVVVVDAGMGHRQLVVVGVEPEEREVRVHHGDVDAVELHVLDDEIGIALGRAALRLAVAGDRPPGKPGVWRRRNTVAPPSTHGSSSSKSSSQTPRSRRWVGRRVLKRSMGSRRCPSPETTKSFVRHGRVLPRRKRRSPIDAKVVDRSVQCNG